MPAPIWIAPPYALMALPVPNVIDAFWLFELTTTDPTAVRNELLPKVTPPEPLLLTTRVPNDVTLACVRGVGVAGGAPLSTPAFKPKPAATAIFDVWLVADRDNAVLAETLLFTVMPLAPPALSEILPRLVMLPPTVRSPRAFTNIVVLSTTLPPKVTSLSPLMLMPLTVLIAPPVNRIFPPTLTVFNIRLPPRLMVELVELYEPTVKIAPP